MALGISFKISAIDEFSKTMDSLNKQTKKAFDTAGQLGAGMTAAGVGIAAGFGLAVKTTADFESAMSRVGALSGATESDLQSLTKTAKDLGASTSFSATQAAEGMQYLSMAGYKTNDIIAAMPGLLSAAAAGQTDLGTTADITSNILSGFGLQAKETSRVADVLTKTFTSSNVDLAMLGDTMKYVAPTAKAMGISLEETAAAAGILGNAGIQGSQAGTSLSMSLTRLASPAKEARDLMEEIGFTAFDAQGKILPLNKVLENLKTSTANLTDEQRMHAISTIFGAESMKAMLTLMEAGPDTLSKFTGELKNAGGAAEEIATKQLDNLKGQFTILMSAIEGAAISFGTALLPAVKSVVSGFQWLIDLFNGLPESVKTTIAIITALTALFLLFVGPLLILVALIPSIIGGFTAIAGAFGITAGVLAGGIAVVSGVVVAIVALGAAFVIAYQKLDWFRTMVDAAWAWIKNAFSTALDFISGIVKTVMTEVSTFFGQQLAKIKSFWEENGDLIVKFVKSFMDATKTYIQAGMQFIKGIFQVVWPIISGLVKVAWGVIKTVISTGLDVVLGLVETAMKLLEGDWEGAWESIKDIGEDIWHNIEDFFSGIDLVEIGKDIIRGLIDGIASMGGSVKKTVGKIVDAIPDAVKKILGIHSPSRVLMELGGYTAEGLAVGIGKGITGIQRMAGAMANAATPSMGGQSLNYGLAGGSGSSATAGSNGATNYNYERMFEGAVFNVRKDEDIKRIADELYRMQQSAKARRGIK
jgi:TP901 family phage tail tape measure protein